MCFRHKFGFVFVFFCTLMYIASNNDIFTSDMKEYQESIKHMLSVLIRSASQSTNSIFFQGETSQPQLMHVQLVTRRLWV